MSGEEWETNLTSGHGWWKPWEWRVIHTTTEPHYHLESRSGYARTKEKARRAAVKAQLAMGREDVHLVETL